MGSGEQGLGRAGDNYGAGNWKISFPRIVSKHNGAYPGGERRAGCQFWDWVGVRVGVGFFEWGMAPTHDNLQQIVASAEHRASRVGWGGGGYLSLYGVLLQ